MTQLCVMGSRQGKGATSMCVCVCACVGWGGGWFWLAGSGEEGQGRELKENDDTHQHWQVDETDKGLWLQVMPTWRPRSGFLGSARGIERFSLDKLSESSTACASALVRASELPAELQYNKEKAYCLCLYLCIQADRRATETVLPSLAQTRALYQIWNALS